MTSNENQSPALTSTGDHHHGRRSWRQQQQKYSPNAEESRVLRECQNDSFWYRALPIGLLSGLGVYMLIQRRILSTKTRFGPLPKVMFGGMFGYIVGKVSYVSTCKQKLLRLDNSPIAEMLRKGMSPGAIAANTQFGKDGFGSQDDTMFTGGGNDQVGDDYSANLDIDTSYGDHDVSIEGYDQNTATSDPEVVAAKRPEMTMTYEQLRKQNRGQTVQPYQDVSSTGQFSRQLPPSSESAPPKPTSSRSGGGDDELTLGRSKKLPKKNAYGDFISDE